MKNLPLFSPMTKTVILMSLVAGSAMTACHSAQDAARTKDISTDLGTNGVTYYYKIEGDKLVRSRCQPGESTPSFCQEDTKKVALDRFKVALGLLTKSTDDAHRQWVYDLLASGIVFRPLANNELLSELRPIISQMDASFDKASCEFGKTSDGPNGSKFASICFGSFMMGSPDNEADRSNDEGPQHLVTLTKNFELQTTEVTQAEWVAVMGSNPSHFKESENCPGEFTTINSISMCPNNPVEQVRWNDAQAFISKLNAKADGYTYRLPTEAEWEYAARAGTTGAYAGDLDSMAWYDKNSGGMSHPVGTQHANAWGLFDMHGNVYEWTADLYGAYSVDPVTDPVGPSSSSNRVIRGGGWLSDPEDCRASDRLNWGPGNRHGSVGFRLLRTSP